MLSAFWLKVRKRHAFLSKAFTRPVEEPAVPLTHWSYLLKEMEWLAADVAQVSATCNHLAFTSCQWVSAKQREQGRVRALHSA